MNFFIIIIFILVCYLIYDRFILSKHINKLNDLLTIPKFINLPELNTKDVINKMENTILKNKSMICFIRIPKNASTSLYMHLLNNNCIRDEYLLELLNKPKYHSVFAPSHCTISESIEYLGQDIKKLPFLLVCRNPYDRMVSMYNYFITNNKITRFKNLTETIDTFKKFVNFCIKINGNEEYAMIWMSQCDYIDTEDNYDIDLTIIRYENLNKGFEKFIKDKNLDDIDINLPWLNKSNYVNYNNYYNQKLKNKVYSLWEKDFIKFKYNK